MELYNEYISKLKCCVLDALKGEDIKVFVFGSRARGDGHRTSDIDIGYRAGECFDKKKLIFLKNELEKVNIPYKVELVNFDEVGKDFKEEALKDIVVWKD